MLLVIIRNVLVFVGGFIGYKLAGAYQDIGLAAEPSLGEFSNILHYLSFVLVGALFGFVVGGTLGRYFQKIVDRAEEKSTSLSILDLAVMAVGLFIGLLIAMLAATPFQNVDIIEVRLVIDVVIFIFFGYLGAHMGFKKRFEVPANLIPVSLGKRSSEEIYGSQGVVFDKILDTSVIIDGRILDISKTFFIEGRLSVPRFVLNEMQIISDSTDHMKRSRGRRGLDVLNQLKRLDNVEVYILDTDYPEIPDVDSKLVRLAKDTGGLVITNDYNLNRVAELQGVRVLNINELANALKPIVLPGEEMHVKVIREGKESGQGVGYLDDGTMVVVEQGQYNIGKEMDVQVTSVLQTPAGRMIFTRPKQGSAA